MNVLNLKDIISIKIKARDDPYTDQWNRIFMSKIFLITSLIIGIDYFHDDVSCIMPNADIDADFVRSSCWITGFYIYPDLKLNWEDVGYHGIPRDLSLDGTDSDRELCSTYNKNGKRIKSCKPLRKLFYLQYQWYPFFVATIGLSFYLPYLVFRMVNVDIIGLKKNLDQEKPDIEPIIKTYFNYGVNPKTSMCIRTVANIVVKLMYIAVTIVSFYLFDISLNGKFLNYGFNWVKWTKLNNTMAFDIHIRGFPKPGNELLPPIGICEVHESSRDLRNTVTNRHIFICEISPNILYQYCLILLWFLLVITLFISTLGFIMEVAAHCTTILCLFWRGKDSMKIYRTLTFRECEYLEFVKKKNKDLYSELLHRLHNDRVARQEKAASIVFDEGISITTIPIRL